MPISGDVEVITISCVPERSDCVACRSPPSAPPQKAWIFILPPDFSRDAGVHLGHAVADRVLLVDAVGQADGALGELRLRGKREHGRGDAGGDEAECGIS